MLYRFTRDSKDGVGEWGREDAQTRDRAGLLRAKSAEQGRGTSDLTKHRQNRQQEPSHIHTANLGECMVRLKDTCVQSDGAHRNNSKH